MDPTKGIPDPDTIKQRDPFPGVPGGVGGHFAGLFDREVFQRHADFRNHMHNFEHVGEGGHQPELMNMMARMGEIYRIREAGRAQLRLARREEERALRDIRHNQWMQPLVPQPHQGQVQRLHHFHPYPVVGPAAQPAGPLPVPHQQLLTQHQQIGLHGRHVAHHMYNPIQNPHTHTVHPPAPNPLINLTQAAANPPPQPNLMNPRGPWDGVWHM